LFFFGISINKSEAHIISKHKLKQKAIVKPLKLNHFTAAFIKFRFQTNVL
jgi:hypothetical protein